MTQPPSTFTQFVFIGSEVQLFPPSDIGCEYNPSTNTKDSLHWAQNYNIK